MWLDIAIFNEIRQGRGSGNGAIYVDFTNLPQKVWDKYESAKRTINWLKNKRVDLRREPVEIAPFHHAFNGGFKIDRRSETTVPGLFAAGEVAAGPHGADRPGGHMLPVCQVFGAKAGYYAAISSKEIAHVELNKQQVDGKVRQVQSILNGRGTVDPEEIAKQIQDIMWKNCLVVRNSEGLRRSIDTLEEIQRVGLSDMSVEEHDIFRGLAVPNFLAVGKLIAKAALLRRESRGSHYREDYPDLDEKQARRRIFFQTPSADIDVVRRTCSAKKTE